ncbi:MAG: PHP domain-containing protein [Candidatus Bathyarchaeia archaeon]|jgi:predicted metal-dependent phosphoesterase TrpH
MQVNADLHVHSNYSKDSLITPKDLVYYAKKRGLTAVAVTDHNQIEGSLKIAKEADFLIIPGMEVSSGDGHIVALNLKELIPRGLSAKETVERIHAAGGIAVAVHPYAWFKGSLKSHVEEAKFDAVETLNANAFPFNRCKRKATEIAQKLNLPCVGGTDAHYGPTIGYGYTAVDCEPSVDAIIKAIVNGRCQPLGQPIPFTLTLQRQYRLIKRRIFRSARP